ncbi:MAG: hypothetical protein M5U26_06350 [Planctomycetota bacterium]|nr:hypothetical protein [Planctomycetota bacterium]
MVSRRGISVLLAICAIVGLLVIAGAVFRAALFAFSLAMKLVFGLGGFAVLLILILLAVRALSKQPK